MVHKKYIKKGGKIFGPYLYENYRENGKVKTRYLGIEKKKISKGYLIWFFIFLIIVLGLLFFSSFVFKSSADNLYGFFSEKADFGEIFNLGIFKETLDVFVNIIGNSPPSIIGIDNEIFVCENKRLNYFFNVSDNEGADGLNVLISPPNPFFISFGEKFDDESASYKIISGNLMKDSVNLKRTGNEGWAKYPETIIASDGTYFDSVKTNITIIEINNKPVLEDIGVKTIWTKGDDSFFYHELNVSDEEDGNRTDGKLAFNLGFLNSAKFFDIDENGVMKFNGSEGATGNYFLRVCVNDSGLNKEVHPNADLCLPDGDYLLNKMCDDFSLTITDENRKPDITSYYPEINKTLSVLGNQDLYFNISVHDPDGTLADVYWYVNDELIKRDSNNSFYEFRYNFGCEISGNFNLTVVATDGLLNNSLNWNVSVGFASCGGNVAGGGGGVHCKEEWTCKDWYQCRNLEENVNSNSINKSQESLIKERCDVFNYNEDRCGYQTRECMDINECRTIKDRPGVMQECYYTEYPTCNDGIRNCHEGSCELLIDCGGPCLACPSCEDGILNQDEEGIDCGGSCSPCTEKPSPVLLKTIFSYSLIFILIILLILLLYEIRRYYLLKRERRKQEVKKIFPNPAGVSFLIFAVILLVVSGGYLLNILNKDKIIIEVGKEGFLGSSGLMSSFLRNFAETFSINIIESVIGSNADLNVWDETDNGNVKYTEGSLYGKTESDWKVFFYADYKDKSGNPINSGNGNGNCEIKFYDESVFSAMSFNFGSGLWEYSRSFHDKGNLNFEIKCLSDYENLNIITFVKITNTPPLISLNLPTIQFEEDNYSSYDFGSKVFDDDRNDILSYSLRNISGINPSFYSWILMNAEDIFINATRDEETGNFNLGIEVVDSEEESVSRTQAIRINPVNDAPNFLNLEDKILNSGELFEYEIKVNDEENNAPFVFNIEFLSCSNEAERGNCDLFLSDDYIVYGQLGILNISFSPNSADIGEYEINFSVKDTNEIGDKTTSRIINFSVVIPIWNNPVVEHFLIEDSSFYLDLRNMILDEYKSGLSFSYEDGFGSFDLISEGIINFIPSDKDVGLHRVKIIAQNGALISSKFFNFSVENVPDSVRIIKPLTADNVYGIDSDSNMEILENSRVKIYLFAEDGDLGIEQKDFCDSCDEILNVSVEINGPNPNLFNFVFDSLILENREQYFAEFILRDEDVGDYNVKLNVSDSTGNSDIMEFDITVINRDYDIPVIRLPEMNYEFGLTENVSSQPVFMANHSVGDELTYRIYFDDELKHENLGPGDSSNFTFSFSPNFSDETYGEIKDLTLVVLNQFFNEMNDSRTWNLTVEHSNSPVEFYNEIGDKVLPYDYSLEIDLKEHFSDADYFDSHYNQSMIFEVKSNASQSFIVSEISEEWVLKLSSLKYVSYLEMLNITAKDLDSDGKNLSNATSNNFLIEFVESEPRIVAVPSSGSGDNSDSSNIISLKLITPKEISAYEGEKIEIPLSLINRGTKTFSEIKLTSSGYKNGSLNDKVKTSLSKDKIRTLNPGKEEDLTLTVSFEDAENKAGDYEVLINLSSSSPKYSDWGKIYINLQRINETRVREILIFTEDFVAQNPECIEIKEIVKEAEGFFQQGDYLNARTKTEEALDACKNSISQVSLPRKTNRYFYIIFYFVLVSVLALALGIIYYLLQRWRIEHGVINTDKGIKYKEVMR